MERKCKNVLSEHNHDEEANWYALTSWSLL